MTWTPRVFDSPREFECRREHEIVVRTFMTASVTVLRKVMGLFDTSMEPDPFQMLSDADRTGAPAEASRYWGHYMTTVERLIASAPGSGQAESLRKGAGVALEEALMAQSELHPKSWRKARVDTAWLKSIGTIMPPMSSSYQLRGFLQRAATRMCQRPEVRAALEALYGLEEQGVSAKVDVWYTPRGYSLTFWLERSDAPDGKLVPFLIQEVHLADYGKFKCLQDQLDLTLEIAREIDQYLTYAWNHFEENGPADRISAVTAA